MTLNQRQSYGETLVKLGEENKNIVVLEADLGKSTMTYLFENAFPNRFFEMGIAEQNMTSTAAGLSLTGKIPFVNSFAVFASGRAYDQIRQSICVPNLNVKICGSSSGLSDFGDGSTHQSIEDVALMRALPNMSVFVPVDAVDTEKIINYVSKTYGPCYIKINRNDMPQYFDANDDYDPLKVKILKDGKDVAIFASGIMVSKAMKASEILQNEGISAKVINVSCLKPLDKKGVLDAVSNVKAIVTAEEHIYTGGLFSAISEALAGEISRPINYVAIDDVFGTSAYTYDELLIKYGLTEKEIVNATKKIL